MGGVDVDAVAELLQAKGCVDDEAFRAAWCMLVSGGVRLDVLEHVPMPRSGCMKAMRSFAAM